VHEQVLEILFNRIWQQSSRSGLAYFSGCAYRAHTPKDLVWWGWCSKPFLAGGVTNRPLQGKCSTHDLAWQPPPR